MFCINHSPEPLKVNKKLRKNVKENYFNIQTFADKLTLLLLGPDVVIIFCNHLHHALQTV